MIRIEFTPEKNAVLSHERYQIMKRRKVRFVLGESADPDQIAEQNPFAKRS